jgi:hypothetical protein
MGNLIRVHDGLIESQNFSTELISPWILSPSNANIDKTSGLKIFNSPADVSLIRNVSFDCCVIDIKNTFNPLEILDVSRISIFENDISLDLEEYYDAVEGTSNTYPYFRIIKNFNSYSFHWSSDGLVWNFIATEDIALDTPSLKITLVGGGSQDYILDFVKIYELPIVRIRNISAGNTVEVYNSNNVLVGSNKVILERNYADIELINTELPLSGYIKILDSTNTQVGGNRTFTEMWGGSIYSVLVTLDLYNELDEPLTTESIKALGMIRGEYFEKLFRVKNNSTVPILGCSLMVKSVAEGDGSELVFIAPENDNVNGYSTAMILGDMNPNDEIHFWLKINKDVINTSRAEIDFALEVDSD